METSFEPRLAEGYKSKSQIARVLTESWTKAHMYCPICGHPGISKFPNNKAAADFFCPSCQSEFEQKSKNGPFGDKIADGAYSTFIQRICSNNNPNFFLMSYSHPKMRVESLYFVPKYFFVPEVVEKRKPLSVTAKRAGWTGCNILFHKIPVQGRIPVILGGISIDKELVMNQVKQAQKIQTYDLAARGWLLDVLHCVNTIEEDVFTLEKMYAFEAELAEKHPDNRHIREKIRQQLQQLRDRGVILFLEKGLYRKNR